MAKSEGATVRHAMNGPDIEHDQLIGKIEKWNGEDRARASTAAETRGEIGTFVEKTGINPKALSLLRLIAKTAKKDGGQAKAMDIIRSIEKGLPMLKLHIGGNQAEMALDEPVDPAPLGKPSYDPDADLSDLGVVAGAEEDIAYVAEAPADEPIEFSDDEIAQEAAAFEDHLAEVTA